MRLPALLVPVLALELALTMVSTGSAGAQAEAGPIQIEWLVEDTPAGGWTVGDQLSLRLLVSYPAGITVILPSLPETWGPFEVLDQTPLAPAEGDAGRRSVILEATLTVWAPGEHLSPATAVRYRDADGQLHEVFVPQVAITVVSVLENDETEKRDLKSQVSLPEPPLWPWILGGIVLTALVCATGFTVFSRLRDRPAGVSVAPTLSDPRRAHEIAYSELVRIASLELPAKGEFKVHYSLVADCLRAYVQGRYKIPAMDQTTEELIAAFRRKRVQHDQSILFRDLLGEADLVKFARYRPSTERARTVISQARHIVDVTKVDERLADGEVGAASTDNGLSGRAHLPKPGSDNQGSSIP